MKVRSDARQESEWKRAAKISGMSLDEWAGMHLDICAGLALASVGSCELCRQNADAPGGSLQIHELPEPEDEAEGRQNELDARS